MEANNRLQVEYVDLVTLKAYDNNAKKHSEEQIEAVCNSIREFGFDLDDEGPSLGDVEEDEVPEEVVCRCKRGDVWTLGNHRIMCGSATDPDDMEMLTGGVLSDMTLTDPPYNVAYTGKTKDALTIDNDSFSDEDSFKAFLTQAFALAERHMRPGAAFYVFHADRHGLAFRQACEDAGLPVRQVLQWVKQSFVLGRQDYQWRHEPCLYGWKPGAAHYFLDSRSEDTVMEDEEPDVEKMRKAELQDLAKRLLADRTATTVMKFDRPSRSEDHPTMKPVKLLAYLVRNSTRRGQTVLDPFSGSGSTLIACEQLDRRCFAMELDPHYCDVIIERWERLTGLEAVKDG